MKKSFFAICLVFFTLLCAQTKAQAIKEDKGVKMSVSLNPSYELEVRDGYFIVNNIYPGLGYFDVSYKESGSKVYVKYTEATTGKNDEDLEKLNSFLKDNKGDIVDLIIEPKSLQN